MRVFEDFIDSMDSEDVVSRDVDVDSSDDEMTASISLYVSNAHHGLYLAFSRVLNIFIWFSRNCPFIG